jgi:hypothetical protein
VVGVLWLISIDCIWISFSSRLLPPPPVLPPELPPELPPFCEAAAVVVLTVLPSG